jgi:hypothetical protein
VIVFSEYIVQEIVALAIAALAFVYLVRRFGGRRKKAPSQPVVVSERLSRGLKAANKAGDSDPAQ